MPVQVMEHRGWLAQDGVAGVKDRADHRHHDGRWRAMP